MREPSDFSFRPDLFYRTHVEVLSLIGSVPAIVMPTSRPALRTACRVKQPDMDRGLSARCPPRCSLEKAKSLGSRSSQQNANSLGVGTLLNLHCHISRQPGHPGRLNVHRALAEAEE